MSSAEKIVDSIEFTLDHQLVVGYSGESILDVARRYGIAVPHLCYKEGYRPDGNCRACMVEIEGERVLAPACCRSPASSMNIQAASPRALAAQRMIVELLLSDMSPQSYSRESELDFWAKHLAVNSSRFSPRTQPTADNSHPAISVNLDACIQCTRCVRACREEQVNDVIGYAGRGMNSKIVFDFDDPMGDSSCVACGECVQACPTGALSPATGAALVEPDKQVNSLCPYCGVGCQLIYDIKDDSILQAQGRDGPSNHKRLCVKGRYGYDYARHPHRLTSPLIRREDAPKSPDAQFDPADWRKVFREATWEEALELSGSTLAKIRDEEGGNSLAGFGSAKGSNEEAYLFQKLVRVGLGTNNVDHCTRLCHASSVAALLEGIGSGAVSNQVSDVSKTDLIFVIGANPTENHPVAATWIKNAAKSGIKLVVADPRQLELGRHADICLKNKPGSDIALLSAMMNVIISEDLVDHEFIKNRTSGFEEIRQAVMAFDPESMEKICGIDAETIRKAARMYAEAKNAMILWGMGISQHVHGTDNVRCLIALALMTGQIGRPGAGLHPLRGQNNVQGASDAGLIPMMYPDYRPVEDSDAQAEFEQHWGTTLNPERGLTVVEVLDGIMDGNIKGMYIMGENPAMSDPDTLHARLAISRLEMLVVQDIFMTETAMLSDVILPASAFPEKSGTFTNTDRMVQLGRKMLPLPGDARQDLWIIQEMAKRLGLSWDYEGLDSGVAQVFEEMRSVMRSISGITWARLESEHSVTYPCRVEGDPGEPVLFIDKFPTSDGLGHFVPVNLSSAAEQPDEAYPFVLITGRELEHWHTGAMTRRSQTLDALQPIPTVAMHPKDVRDIGGETGDSVTISSRRGSVVLSIKETAMVPEGVVFIPFCYYEAPANVLTNPKLDPFGKIPEFKYCAVNVSLGGDLIPHTSFGGGNTSASASIAR